MQGDQEMRFQRTTILNAVYWINTFCIAVVLCVVVFQGVDAVLRKPTIYTTLCIYLLGNSFLGAAFLGNFDEEPPRPDRRYRGWWEHRLTRRVRAGFDSSSEAHLRVRVQLIGRL